MTTTYLTLNVFFSIHPSRRVRKLMEHPSFDLTNPNRVMSVARSFVDCLTE